MDVPSFVQHCSHAQQGSPEMTECVLSQVQEYVTFKNIALFTYLALVALVGLLGNSLILVVYFRRSKKTATIVFICAIAVTDLLTNLLVIPVTFYVLMNSVNVEPYMCKVYYFLTWSATTTSVMLLLAVAVVRYRKICVPFGRQVTLRHARSFSIGIAVLIIVLCIPHSVVTGRLTVEVISTANLTVFECAVDNEYANSIWPKVINGLSTLIFLLCCVPLTVMYLQIGIEAHHRRPAHELAFKNNKSMGGLENGENVKAQQLVKWNLEQDNTSSLSQDQDTSMSENPRSELASKQVQPIQPVLSSQESSEPDHGHADNYHRHLHFDQFDLTCDDRCPVCAEDSDIIHGHASDVRVKSVPFLFCC